MRKFLLSLFLLLATLVDTSNAIDTREEPSDDESTPPSNITTGSLARGQNDVWASKVPIGPSKKYMECKKLLENELNSPAPCPAVHAAASGGGYHLSPVTTPSQGYARAAGMTIFLFVFFLVVGFLKILTTNIVFKHLMTSFAPALVVMYSEISVFAIIGLIGFIVLRLDTLPKYSATFLPSQSTDTMTIMFENVELTMFMFIVFYAMFGVALVYGGMNVSNTWGTYEANAGNRCGDDYVRWSQAKEKQNNYAKIHKENNISYLCLRDDFVRNSPGRHGLRGPDNAAQFDFSRYLTLQLTEQLSGILKMTFPQWLLIFVGSMLAALSSAFPLSLQLVLGQLCSWGLVVFASIFHNKVKDVGQYLNRGLRGRGVVDDTASDTEKSNLLENNPYNEMLTSSTKQESYFCCGDRSGSYMRGMQRGILFGTALVAALQVQLCVRAAHVSYGWALGLLALIAMLITLHLLGRILLHSTLMTSVEFQRNVKHVDQVIGEQSEILTQCAARHLTYLACELSNSVTKRHALKCGENTLIRAQNELEAHCLQRENIESNNNISTYNKLMHFGVQVLATNTGDGNGNGNDDNGSSSSSSSNDNNIKKLQQLLTWFDISWVDDDLCKFLLGTSKNISKGRSLEDHFQWSLKLILELTSPDSDLPLQLMSKKLGDFTRGNYLLSLIKSRQNKFEGKHGEDLLNSIKEYFASNSELDGLQAHVEIDFPNSKLSDTERAAFDGAVDKARTASTHAVEVTWPLLITTKTAAGVNRADSRYLVKAMETQHASLKLMDFVRLARLIVSRAQTIQSKWQLVYPRVTDVKGRPITATIGSLARAMHVTAMGAHGATVVALAGRPPEPRVQITEEMDNGTKV